MKNADEISDRRIGCIYRNMVSVEETKRRNTFMVKQQFPASLIETLKSRFQNTNATLNSAPITVVNAELNLLSGRFCGFSRRVINQG